MSKEHEDDQLRKVHLSDIGQESSIESDQDLEVCAEAERPFSFSQRVSHFHWNLSYFHQAPKFPGRLHILRTSQLVDICDKAGPDFNPTRKKKRQTERTARLSQPGLEQLAAFLELLGKADGEWFGRLRLTATTVHVVRFCGGKRKSEGKSEVAETSSVSEVHSCHLMSRSRWRKTH